MNKIYIQYGNRIGEVTRETKTLYITDIERYNKKTKRPSGYERGYFSPQPMEILNEEQKDKFLEKRRLEKELEDRIDYIHANIRKQTSHSKVTEMYNILIGRS